MTVCDQSIHLWFTRKIMYRNLPTKYYNNKKQTCVFPMLIKYTASVRILQIHVIQRFIIQNIRKKLLLELLFIVIKRTSCIFFIFLVCHLLENR